ncbi:hypothetical protein JCM8115_003658 [Rhodotorula mucilaginosa]|uniref:Glutathione S-transferase n=1 Tax=Rhodotorula mucilaginosa TaxID=5537 RepID=A0A9P6W936_RHOMI|nr:hypothetical protein C6P46_006384 [Rhodotorula mucilaginosa]
MPPSQPITIFSARVCPWAQRATLALREVGAYEDGTLKHVEIDLQNKPDWYASKVNPASKVPVIRVGEEGAPGTLNIPESAVDLELVADLYPEKKLSPEDPVKRAYARYFAQRFTDVVTSPFMTALFQGKPEAADSVFTGIEEIQGMLTQFDGPFLLGNDISIGDLAVAPFVGRIFAGPKYDLLPKDFADKLEDDKFKVFRAYRDALVTRPSWKETFDEEYVMSHMKHMIEKRRAAAAAEAK